MLSDVLNAAFTVISAFSTSSSSGESSSSSSTSDEGEERGAAPCPPPTAAKVVVGRQHIALEKPSLHEQRHKALNEPLVRIMQWCEEEGVGGRKFMTL